MNLMSLRFFFTNTGDNVSFIYNNNHSKGPNPFFYYQTKNLSTYLNQKKYNIMLDFIFTMVFFRRFPWFVLYLYRYTTCILYATYTYLYLKKNNKCYKCTYGYFIPLCPKIQDNKKIENIYLFCHLYMYYNIF